MTTPEPMTPARCENCRWWNATGQKSSPVIRIGDTEQLWKRPCQRFPEYVPHWFDDWCGEFTAKEQST